MLTIYIKKTLQLILGIGTAILGVMEPHWLIKKNIILHSYENMPKLPMAIILPQQYASVLLNNINALISQ